MAWSTIGWHISTSSRDSRRALRTTNTPAFIIQAEGIEFIFADIRRPAPMSCWGFARRDRHRADYLLDDAVIINGKLNRYRRRAPAGRAQRWPMAWPGWNPTTSSDHGHASKVMTYLPSAIFITILNVIFIKAIYLVGKILSIMIMIFISRLSLWEESLGSAWGSNDGKSVIIVCIHYHFGFKYPSPEEEMKYTAD